MDIKKELAEYHDMRTSEEAARTAMYEEKEHTRAEVFDSMNKLTHEQDDKRRTLLSSLEVIIIPTCHCQY